MAMLWEWSEELGLASGFVWRKTGSTRGRFLPRCTVLLASKILVGSFSDQGAWHSVVSTDPGVYLEKELLALGNGDAFHVNASL